MIEKVRDYFDRELKDAIRCIENKRKGKGYGWMNEKECVYNAIQRCLGVGMFAQSLGLTYEDIEADYEKIKNELEGLLK